MTQTNFPKGARTDLLNFPEGPDCAVCRAAGKNECVHCGARVAGGSATCPHCLNSIECRHLTAAINYVAEQSRLTEGGVSFETLADEAAEVFSLTDTETLAVVRYFEHWTY